MSIDPGARHDRGFFGGGDPGEGGEGPDDFEAWEAGRNCTHCGGSGTCDDGSDPLGDCPDELHSCHACRGSGLRKDQCIF